MGDRLREGIEEIAREIEGVTAVSARHLPSGTRLEINAEECFPSASVIKIAIMLELIGRADEGDIQLSERARLWEADKVDGSGVLSGMGEGLELTLEDLAHLMITVSDNTASNMLIERLGCEAVTARLQRLGLRTTRLERKFYDFEARDRGLDNWLCAGEISDLLTLIETRKAASPAGCEKMIAIMKRQQFDGRIPKLLPPDTPVANKTGSITAVCHDAGIIYAPSGPIVLTVLTRGIQNEAVAEGGIRHIARLVYEEWALGIGR